MDHSIRHDVNRVFELQQARRWTVAATTAEQRIAKLRSLREAIILRRNDIAKAAYKDFRKSVTEVELTEVHPVLEEINHTISHIESWMAPTRVATPLTLAGTTSMIRYEPRGVVLIISPWNYPFNLLFAPLSAAIAAGNCIVVKPSSKTSHVSEVSAELIRSVFREDEVAIFTGGHHIADQLLELPFDHVLFTGSTSIGKKIMKACSETLASVTLELGGKSPVLIDESADLDAAARRVMWGKCVNAGQTCIAPDYAITHQRITDKFVASSKKILESFYGANQDSWKASPDLARLIDDAAFRRICKLIDESVAMGAKIAVGGQRDASERYIAPTILTDVTTEMPVMKEEIFGPVLPIVSVPSIEDGTAIVRAGEKPLALYAFARDRRVVEQILATTTAGGTAINEVLIHFANPNLPFGGVGASGQGAYHGEHGFRTFSHSRGVLDHSLGNAVPLFHPPYSDLRVKLTSQAVRLIE